MQALDTTLGADKVVLRGGAVGRVMAQAGRDGALTRLRFAEDGAEALGRVCHLSAEEMEIRLEKDQVVEVRENGTRKCAVEFEAGGQPFSFSTVVVGVAGSVVALRQPTELSTTQRRRFWRARVRESTPVGIALPDGSLQCEADILNLSSAGLACRVERQRADSLSEGDRVTLNFEVEGKGPWNVLAEVRAKTDTSDRGHVIVRLQFDGASLSSDLREQLQSLTGQH